MDMRILPVSPPRFCEWDKNTALQGMCIILRNIFSQRKETPWGISVCYKGVRLPSVSALRNRPTVWAPSL